MSRMMSPPIVSDSWLGRGFLRPVLPLHSKEPVLGQAERETGKEGGRETKNNIPVEQPIFLSPSPPSPPRPEKSSRPRKKKYLITIKNKA